MSFERKDSREIRTFLEYKNSSEILFVSRTTNEGNENERSEKVIPMDYVTLALDRELFQQKTWRYLQIFQITLLFRLDGSVCAKSQNKRLNSLW